MTLVYCCALKPSIPTIAVWLVLCIGLLREYPLLVRATLLYLNFFCLGQFIYNIPFPWDHNQTFRDLGLIFYDRNFTFFYFGLQFIALFMISSYLKVRKFFPNLLSPSIDQKQLLPTKSISFRTTLEGLAASDFALIIKDFALLSLFGILYFSSRISLAGLYFCGLTDVHLLNAGYSEGFL